MAGLTPYNTRIADEILEEQIKADNMVQNLLEKLAFVPGSEAAGGIPPAMDPSQQLNPGAPPMDPAMMGGMPPGMDPAMMGGAPPMDPAMMGGAPPMDPAMMGGPPPGMTPEMQPPLTPEVVAQIVDERLANAGNAGNAGKSKGGGGKANLEQELREIKQLLGYLMKQENKSIPPDFLLGDEASGGGEPQPALMGGGGDSPKMGYFLDEAVPPSLHTSAFAEEIQAASEERQQLRKLASDTDILLGLLG